jgi:hypothetical protein
MTLNGNRHAVTALAALDKGAPPEEDPLECLVGQTPASDLAAEMSVVGCCLADSKALAIVEETLSAADFYHDHVGVIFQAIQELASLGTPADAVTVGTFLESRGTLVEVGGPDFLHTVLETVPHAHHARYYANIVGDLARRRRFGLGLQALALQSRNPLADPEELRDELQALLNEPARQSLFTFRQLAEAYPKLHDPLIDGLLRRGEVANIIAPSKIGKSWLAYGLALSVITGRDWFGFPTTAGSVCLIDNELHAPTIVHRIRAVADAMKISHDEYADSLTVWPMRGSAVDVLAIGRRLNRLSGQFSLLILDAKYRAMPSGATENSNEDETAFYNEQDRWATLGPAVANIHHSTKGGQADRRVTDVGAGGGAQSRAADTHIVLREHEEADTFVLEAAVRSFKPVEPIGLRWSFPVWIPDSTVDASKLKRQPTRQDENQTVKDAEADRAVLDACPTWKTRGEIAAGAGMGEGRTNRAIARLANSGLLDQDEQDRPRHPKSEVFRRSIHAGSDQPRTTNPGRVGDGVGGVASGDRHQPRAPKGGAGVCGRSNSMADATGGVGQQDAPKDWDEYR